MEIERQFLINGARIPYEWRSSDFIIIEQAYLAVSDYREVRVRKQEFIKNHSSYKVEYILTVKEETEDMLMRHEYEIPLDEECYKMLVQNRPVLKKHRYDISKYLGHYAVLDIYLNLYYPLCVVEIEFENEEDANNYVPPPDLYPEVTHLSTYRAKNLIKHVKKEDDDKWLD